MMRTLFYKLGIAFTLLALVAERSLAFSVVHKGSSAVAAGSYSTSAVQAFLSHAPTIATTSYNHRLPPLRYRLADEEDDETTLLRVKNRTPPGFDMRKNLQENEQETTQNPPKSAVNRALVKALLINQALILFLGTVVGCLSFFFADGFGAVSDLSSVFQWNDGFASVLPSGSNRLLFGLLGAIPALLFSNTVENSDRREFANVNFSTIIMVLTLFGRRSSPAKEFLPDSYQSKAFLTTSSVEALLYSLLLSVVTGVCEETVFRVEIPSLMTRFLGWDPITTLLGSALAFGLGHAQPGTGLKENGIVVALQAANGLWFGLIYLLAGGDIGTCMITHAVFDFVVFFKTWSDANAQVEYAERMCLEPLDPEEEREVKEALRSAPGKKDEPRILNNVKRLFYTFDFDKNSTLSLSEVRKGLSYYALERQGNPPQQEQVDALFAKAIASRKASSTEDSNRLHIADFVRLTSLSSQQKAAASGGG